MNNELAERGGQQSGQRFLNGSAPQLIRHAAPCRTAGRESSALPAGKDQKPFREFEGGALISAEGAVPSLLDSITNNRHTDQPDCYARPLGRGKYCGWFSITGKDPKTNRTDRSIRLRVFDRDAKPP